MPIKSSPIPASTLALAPVPEAMEVVQSKPTPIYPTTPVPATKPNAAEALLKRKMAALQQGQLKTSFFSFIA